MNRYPKKHPLLLSVFALWPWLVVAAVIVLIGVITTREPHPRQGDVAGDNAETGVSTFENSRPTRPESTMETITLEELDKLILDAGLAQADTKRWQEAHRAVLDVVQRRYDGTFTPRIFQRVLADELDCTFEEFAANLKKGDEMAKLKEGFRKIREERYHIGPFKTVTVPNAYRRAIEIEWPEIQMWFRRLSKAHGLLVQDAHSSRANR